MLNHFVSNKDGHRWSNSGLLGYLSLKFERKQYPEITFALWFIGMQPECAMQYMWCTAISYRLQLGCRVSNIVDLFKKSNQFLTFCV
ncbi:hypothetical protein SAMN05421877_10910 [Sphingobacterium lactis]|uniref:Uncharacterized protein n=1 Tax=Sphingobacterium lactis TaxID=797291 RepID=A0A1H6AWM7_9SPHI|nr:hypothetical protein SAMN05421877_10910 [Sphingobacterium lactis]